MVKIYTRTGDQGQTSLFGGQRVGKDHGRLEAYGTLDELNAYLGWFRARTDQPDLNALAQGIQSTLFDIGAHLATPPDAGKARDVLPEIPKDRITALEAAIDRLDTELEPLTAFIIPGGTEEAAILHVARAVCRRAERTVVRGEQQAGDPVVLAYLNRLSDLLFVMARVETRRAGVAEPNWSPRGPATGK